MSVVHDAIPWVRLSSGVCHAVAGRPQGWYDTACGTLTPNGTIVDKPHRKCRRCVDVLKTATLCKHAAPGAGRGGGK